ncbi:endospore germination permease [Cytobacillus sp. FJAT-53684]|uniref:Endospore germination permease n=1 Tax=Cytobacillus mangrovibacter TaxID=3299024 RepID=A0ABW6K2F8_9BACI
MNKYSKSGITQMQYIFLIHGVQVGVGVLQIPRVVAEGAGTDGWISIILGWFLAMLFSLLMVKVMKRYPEGTILELFTHFFGKWIGKVVTILFALYFAAITFLTFIRSLLFLQSLVFPEIQVYSLIILLSIPSYVIARNNIRILGRYSELIFFMTIWMITLFFLPLKENAHWLHFLPLFKEGLTPILLTVQSTVFSFVGFEVVLFLYPFLQKKEAAVKGILIANTLTMVAMLLITIGVFAIFSPDEITQFNTPAIEVLKLIEFRFLERIDLIFFAYYTLVMSASWIPLMFFTVFCTSQLLGKQDHRRHLLWFLIVICISVYVYPPTFPKNDQFQKEIEKVFITVDYILPLFLLVAIWIRGFFKRRTYQ